MVVGSDSTCEVCDQTDDTVGYWPQGVRAHAGCVPAHWQKDRTDQETFLKAAHRVHYELYDDGQVEAHCLKCGWQLADWPAAFGNVHSKASEHSKGTKDS